MVLQDQFEGIKVAIGDNLKRLRRDRNWTQSDLADASGVMPGQLSKIELNKADPKLQTIYSIINALECSPNALLSDVDDLNLDGRMAMALERAQQLPDQEKNILLDVIDKYCIAVSLQGMLDSESKQFLGLTRSQGKTQELSRKQ